MMMLALCVLVLVAPSLALPTADPSEDCSPRVDGSWSEWTGWEGCACDYSTGNGTRERLRICNAPSPTCGGEPCEGAWREEGPCEEGDCCKTVDGQWGDWDDWEGCVCDNTAGTGVQMRRRACDSPGPACNGAACPGERSEERSCDEECCTTVDGGWSEWAGIGGCVCNYTTGTGALHQLRRCNSPEPVCNGAPCGGEGDRVVSCDDECCQTVNGGWSEWGNVSSCSCDYTTGTGQLTQMRQCNNPAPACWGEGCGGVPFQMVSCDDECCERVDGEWAEWSEWGACACNHSNGSGVERRTRSCSAPAPSCYGAPCPGEEEGEGVGVGVEERACDEQCCTTTPGGWGEWGGWLCSCDMVRRSGFTVRYRECNDPAPSCGGEICEGSSNHTIYTSK